ncbi:hypothetical protein HAX54_003548 [Datura stramonium]|uniref:Uncharacterized protein n=1 Tax=Datura stramonium TaxID=4076 RepID=A0ABS8T7P5_DATST|nr:hypothetical protein [Datura stramonium]
MSNIITMYLIVEQMLGYSNSTTIPVAPFFVVTIICQHKIHHHGYSGVDIIDVDNRYCEINSGRGYFKLISVIVVVEIVELTAVEVRLLLLLVGIVEQMPMMLLLVVGTEELMAAACDRGVGAGVF